MPTSWVEHRTCFHARTAVCTMPLHTIVTALDPSQKIPWLPVCMRQQSLDKELHQVHQHEPKPSGARACFSPCMISQIKGLHQNYDCLAWHPWCLAVISSVNLLPRNQFHSHWGNEPLDNRKLDCQQAEHMYMLAGRMRSCCLGAYDKPARSLMPLMPLHTMVIRHLA